ncbi:MAG TPA: nuclear transport factor 2 family protein [Gemmatimonadales bacterium]|nr:nuclear transport factor 2 family protein [Gemmatimonadales bacterium]
MLRATLLLVLPLIASTPARGQSTPSPTEDSVRAVVQTYLHGLKFNDVPSLQAAFWPEARLYFVRRDGQLGQLTQEQWYAGLARSAGKEEEGDLRIAALEVTRDIAWAKVIEEYPASRYVDYVSLLRIGGRWLIVNKVFTSERK